MVLIGVLEIDRADSRLALPSTLFELVVAEGGSGAPVREMSPRDAGDPETALDATLQSAKCLAAAFLAWHQVRPDLIDRYHSLG